MITGPCPALMVYCAVFGRCQPRNIWPITTMSGAGQSPACKGRPNDPAVGPRGSVEDALAILRLGGRAALPKLAASAQGLAGCGLDLVTGAADVAFDVRSLPHTVLRACAEP
jgi:hypothetical protein